MNISTVVIASAHPLLIVYGLYSYNLLCKKFSLRKRHIQNVIFIAWFMDQFHSFVFNVIRDLNINSLDVKGPWAAKVTLP